jgi:ribosomal protein S18 acetylase RimI-like enzyme
VSAADLQIRLLTPADAASYRAIRLAGLKDAPEAFGSTFEAEVVKPLAWFFDRLTASQILGAFGGPDLLGVAGFAVRDGEKEAHKGLLWGMYVRPEARGTGIAQRLVEAVVDFACPRVELIQLSVVMGNEPARRLYARLGFVEYGIEKKLSETRWSVLRRNSDGQAAHPQYRSPNYLATPTERSDPADRRSATRCWQ